MVHVDDGRHALRLLLVAAFATAAALVAVRVAGPEDRAGLVAFYRKVRPVGFWGPIAREAGAPTDDGPRRLRRALAATGTCALCVFCLLVGIGSWLAGSPAPAWFPFEAAWRGGLIAAGVALVPLWYRLGYRNSGAPS